jgi:hypothetical protein
VDQVTRHPTRPGPGHGRANCPRKDPHNAPLWARLMGWTAYASTRGACSWLPSWSWPTWPGSAP